MSKRGKHIDEAAGFLVPARIPDAEEGVQEGGVEGVHGRVRRKPGPRPDPAKRVLRKYLVKLRPDHHQALGKAASKRLLRGRDKRFDASAVLRLLLDEWIAKGAPTP